MIANVEFRIHPFVQPDCFVLCNLKYFSLVEQNSVMCYVNSDKEVTAIMRDPSDFLKKIQEMQVAGVLP